MNLFNDAIIKSIIDRYFNKQHIRNYIYYDNTFYQQLASIVNKMILIPEYHRACYIFNYNFEFIDLSNLLENYKIFLDYQIFLAFIYEVLVKMQILDCYNFIVNSEKLIEELDYYPEFNFLKDILNDLRIDLLAIQFSTFS
jgi:hypothetical protein